MQTFFYTENNGKRKVNICFVLKWIWYVGEYHQCKNKTFFMPNAMISIFILENFVFFRLSTKTHPYHLRLNLSGKGCNADFSRKNSLTDNLLQILWQFFDDFLRDFASSPRDYFVTYLCLIQFYDFISHFWTKSVRKLKRGWFFRTGDASLIILHHFSNSNTTDRLILQCSSKTKVVFYFFEKWQRLPVFNCTQKDLKRFPPVDFKSDKV